MLGAVADPFNAPNRPASKAANDLLGGPFDLVSRVSKVGYGDYKRASK